MDFDGLDRQLRDSLADLKLSNEERDELRQLGSELAPDQVRFLRNRAFDLVRELVLLEEQGERIAALKWLEQVVRTLEVTAAPPRSRASAYFSPGEECRRKIRELCRQARQSLDICVFTISDDQLSAEILACHRRGVPVRIISDDDKQFDEGSDIHALREAGVPLRIDDSPFHMHHKFALVDGAWLLNGSFNWTRSASVNNEENLLVTEHRQAKADPGHPADALVQQQPGPHRHQQRQQRGDHPGLGRAGVLQGEGLAEEVQAGFADGQAEQVLPVARAVVDASAPAPGNEEHQAAEGHAAEDHPERRQFAESDLQHHVRTAPQRHRQDQAGQGEPARPSQGNLHHGRRAAPEKGLPV